MKVWGNNKQKTTNTAEDLQSSAQLDVSSPYLIDAYDEIYVVLQKILKSHTLLSVMTEYNETIFGSLLLELNSSENYLVLDELYPRSGIKGPLLDTRLRIYTRIEGIDINFSGIVEAVSGKDDAEYYKLPLPGEIIYKQRRHTYRVPISIAKPVTAALSTSNNVLMHAELRDLSLSGLSARLKSPAAEELQEGDEIPTCIIQSGGKKIICSLEIIRVEESVRTRKIIVGARFTGFQNGDYNSLSNLIMKLDRENVKILRRENN